MQGDNGKAPSTDTGTGRQQDDNIDDLGRKPDGSEVDQPGAAEPAKGDGPAKDKTRDPAHKPD